MQQPEQPASRSPRPMPDNQRVLAAREVIARTLSASARQSLSGRALSEDDAEALSVYLGIRLTREDFIMHTQMRGRPRSLEEYEGHAFGPRGTGPSVHYYLVAEDILIAHPDTIFSATQDWDGDEPTKV